MLVGIETDRGPWVTALVAAGYTVFAVNPRQVARYRERHAMSGAKSDAGDAHVLADMVRTDAHQLRPVAGDSALVEGIKLVARAHQTLIWERQRHVMRLRAGLRDFFPAALDAFDDLAGADTLELLEGAPDPARAARLSRTRIVAALRRARRHHAVARAEQIHAALRGEQLALPAQLVAAYAAIVRARLPADRGVQHPDQPDSSSRSGTVRPAHGRRDLPQPARPRGDPRRAGARRVRRRPRPLRRRAGPQELRRQQPDHPRLGQETHV